MKKYDVKRVAVVISIGAGDSKDQAPFMFKMLMMTVMSSIFADKNNQEALFTDGGVGRDLEWCIVRPGGLTVEKPTGVINVIEGEAGSIARADVADFCIGAILEKDFPYARRPRLRYYDTTSTPSTRRPHADPKDALHFERRRDFVGQGPIGRRQGRDDCLECSGLLTRVPSRADGVGAVPNSLLRHRRADSVRSAPGPLCALD